ncbi:MAG TPA: NIPSNAP family protein [Pyrinomonadaceae bacterium]|nr:NIPSNAP family protein [Pyrinomonadaceae bacterium]
MNESIPADASCCSVLELRQYTLKHGERDKLIDLFERHFVESQEAVGMTLVGQFRDRRDPDRFVWLRGFANMESRHKALASFYGGPVWAAYRDAANSTMLDSDNVLLLKPARPEFSFQLSRASENEGVATCVLAGTYQLPQPVAAEVISDFERQVVPVLKVNRVRLEGVFVTESGPNTFTKLPVREGEQVLAWFGSVAADEWSESAFAHLVSLVALNDHQVSLLELDPTPRSRLGGGPVAARATKHDFDFLFGSWKIRNEYLKARLCHSTEWTEFAAQSKVEPLLDGFGHLDRYSTIREGKLFEGITLRLFNPETGEWTIHWADTARARTLLPPMVGRFLGDVAEFYGDEMVNGKKVSCRFRWTRTTSSPRWEQAFSDDEGKTWETNWIMTFTRP